jgi:ketosteroid isomerase-like protein
VSGAELRFADSWEEAVSRRDLDAVTALLAEAVTFRSPAVHRPYVGREVVASLLAHVTAVFGGLEYTAVYTSGDGGVVMQFQTSVAGPDRLLQLEGVDIFRLDAEGRVCEMCVMIRPLSGLQALATAMAARIGPA